MIRYFGTPVTPESFSGAGWRYHAIRFLCWLIGILQGWLTRLMYVIELREAKIEEPEIQERVLEAASTGYEKRRPQDKVASSILSFPEELRTRRNYRESRKNSDLEPDPATRGVPFVDSPLYHRHVLSGLQRRYFNGRKTFSVMENEEPSEGESNDQPQP